MLNTAYLIMIKSSLHGIIKNDQDFSGFEKITCTVWRIMISEIFVTNFIRQLLFCSGWARKEFHVPRKIITLKISRKEG